MTETKKASTSGAQGVRGAARCEGEKSKWRLGYEAENFT